MVRPPAVAPLALYIIAMAALGAGARPPRGSPRGPPRGPNLALMLEHGLELEAVSPIRKATNSSSLPPTLHGIRRGVGWSWQDNAAAVERGGHRFCALVRDNWACVGERYEQVLRRTPRFDTRWALGTLPRHTKIFCEGNSFLAEKVRLILHTVDSTFQSNFTTKCQIYLPFYMMCISSPATSYMAPTTDAHSPPCTKVLTIVCESDGASVWHAARSNSFYAYHHATDVHLLLLDNDR